MARKKKKWKKRKKKKSSFPATGLVRYEYKTCVMPSNRRAAKAPLFHWYIDLFSLYFSVSKLPKRGV